MNKIQLVRGLPCYGCELYGDKGALYETVALVKESTKIIWCRADHITIIKNGEVLSVSNIADSNKLILEI